MNGEMEEISRKSGVEASAFDPAQEAYRDLLQCEWDVLTEAANVAWEHTLEQERWQNEIKREEEQIKEDIWERHKPRPRDALPLQEHRDYVLDRSSLQRSATIAVPCGQAGTVGFVAPDKAALLSWSQNHALQNIAPRKTDETEEELMDYTPTPDTSSEVGARQPCGDNITISPWPPLCPAVTETVSKTALRKTISFV